MKKWYQIKNSSESLTISIHDEIGVWGVSAKDFIADLSEFESVSSIEVSIHSPGGSAFDGLAIYNALSRHPAKVTTRVEGIAASAASIVLMAGDYIEMPEDAFVMIHNPWMGVMGDADALRDAAETLDKIRDSLVNIYQKKTSLSTDELTELLNKETWLSGDEAQEMGFVDTLTQAMKVAALSRDFSRHFSNLPSALINDEVISDVMTSIQGAKEFESYLREAGGISRKLAKALTSKAKELFQREAEGGSDQEILTAIRNLTQKVEKVTK